MPHRYALHWADSQDFVRDILARHAIKPQPVVGLVSSG